MTTFSVEGVVPEFSSKEIHGASDDADHAVGLAAPIWSDSVWCANPATVEVSIEFRESVSGETRNERVVPGAGDPSDWIGTTRQK